MHAAPLQALPHERLAFAHEQIDREAGQLRDLSRRRACLAGH